MYTNFICCSFTFQGGMYVLQLMDTYAASWAVFIMAILECIIIAWLYGMLVLQFLSGCPKCAF